MDVRVRVVERGGVSLKSHLVKTDLGAGTPCRQEDCVLCLTNPQEGGGLNHHRSSAVYSGTCLICQQIQGEEFSAAYIGETGASGYIRTSDHKASIERKDMNTAFAKPLAYHHQDRQGDFRAFAFSVLKTFKSSLYRQVTEAVKIHGSKASIVMNSKLEWHKPLTRPCKI